MKITLLLTFLAAMVLSKRAKWTSHYLQNAQEHQAVCSDGSSPIYFISEISNSKQWLFYLRGGAGCSNDAMCVDRLTHHPYYTSSKGFTGSFSNSNGIFDRDCGVNPGLCEANFVLLPYCSSDWWTGNNTHYIQRTKEVIHFRGLNIVEGVLNELMRERALTEATGFVIAGNSAGGIGAMNLADRVDSLLRPKLRNLAKFKVLVDSSLFLGNPVFKPLPCRDTFYCGVERTFKEGFQIWKSVLNEDCITKLGEEAWRCNLVDPGIRYVKASSMIVVNKYDIFQSQCDGAQGGKSAEHLMNRGQKVAEVVKELIEDKHVDYAVVSSCFFHTTTLFMEEFLKNKIKGKTISEAVMEFVSDKKDALINECEGLGCKETCSRAHENQFKHFSNSPDYS